MQSVDLNDVAEQLAARLRKPITVETKSRRGR
jgi:hypothetical protein